MVGVVQGVVHAGFAFIQRAGGTGGQAGPTKMVLAGPFASDTYTITIGTGGISGAPGGETLFSGAEQTVHFPGGAPSVTQIQQSPPYPDHLDSLTGQDSMYGPGGLAGPPNTKGGDAKGFCAGGGGGGYPQGGTAVFPEGSGGPGYLILYPLPAGLPPVPTR